MHMFACCVQARTHSHMLSWFSKSGWGQRISISNKSPRDAEAAGLGSTIWEEPILGFLSLLAHLRMRGFIPRSHLETGPSNPKIPISFLKLNIFEMPIKKLGPTLLNIDHILLSFKDYLKT